MDDFAVLTDAADLHAIAAEWQDLWLRTPGATPFQAPGWLLPWWREFGTGHRLAVAIRRERGRLVGVLPCYRFHEGDCCKLLPLGVSLSDYFDALIAADASPDTTDRLLAQLLAAVGADTRCDLIDVPVGANLLGARVPDGWRMRSTPGECCPVFRLGDSPDPLAPVPARLRRKLRMNRNRADRLAAWTVRFSEPASISADFATLVDLHQSRWEGKQEPGIFADNRARRFLHEAVLALSKENRVLLGVLEIGGRVAAAQLAFLVPPDGLFLYLGGFAGDLAPVSPGSLLMAALFQHAANAGFRDVHFLRGREAYKYDWGATDCQNTNLLLFHAGISDEAPPGRCRLA